MSKVTIKAILLSTILVASMAAANIHTISQSESLTKNERVERMMQEAHPESYKGLSQTSQQILESIENYPETNLSIEIKGNKAIINGTVKNEMDEPMLIKSLKAFPEIDIVESNIELSE